MEYSANQHYKEQAISTMTPHELLLLLYDELVKRVLRAELTLQKEEYPLFEESILRALDIVRYLDDTLNHDIPISAQLHRLYDYLCFELNRVHLGRNLAVLQQIKPQILDLRESFRSAAANVASGQGDLTPPEAPEAPGAPEAGSMAVPDPNPQPTR